MRETLSAELQRFIRRYLNSVQQLEILLLLFNEPQRHLSVEEISAILRSTASSVRLRLTGLVRRGLVQADDRNRYAYASDEQRDRIVGELRMEYQTRQARVIDFMFSEPSDTVTSFADAFRLKEDDDGR